MGLVNGARQMSFSPGGGPMVRTIKMGVIFHPENPGWDHLVEAFESRPRPTVSFLTEEGTYRFEIVQLPSRATEEIEIRVREPVQGRYTRLHYNVEARTGYFRMTIDFY